jgi:hypothetical protein
MEKVRAGAGPRRFGHRPSRWAANKASIATSPISANAQRAPARLGLVLADDGGVRQSLLGERPRTAPLRNTETGPSSLTAITVDSESS